ncbi:MAG: endonuclease/exonuclease/phosphatase family protein [Arcobacteraceae bacterium]|nr:endonuclease/exonuclease/phosphatase family protein [Arcobacteraceae bacterium]
MYRGIFFKISLLLSFTLTLFSVEFKVASYNVENLFDLKYDGTEYKEFIPNTKYWNKKIYSKKLHNISKTIKHLNTDIIALQEIESQTAFDDLNKKLPSFRYSAFLKKMTSSIGVGIFSKYPIIDQKRIIVNKKDNYARDILKVTINIENKPVIIYINHWRSKRAKESYRIIYATALKNSIDKLHKDTDYLIVGDLNSNYDEYLTFKYDKKLNNTYDITGINQVLNTTLKGNFITKNNIQQSYKKVHYNLWLELKEKDRFSSKFRNNNNTPDHIIVSRGLFDNKNISYMDKSFKVFKPLYLYKNNKIKRWNNHKQTGYSDHLPIYASFTTSTKYVKKIKEIKPKNINSISHLYTIDTLNKNILLKDVIVIYKDNKISIIKEKNGRAILIYGNSNRLYLGCLYDIEVEQIDKYFGLKEIKSIANITNKKNLNIDIKKLYLDAKKIDIFDLKYQNEILKNLKGKYKKGYLHLNNKTKNHKIKLYFKKGIMKPNENSIITINQGHLNQYKSQIQIVIYKNSDFK